MAYCGGLRAFGASLRGRCYIGNMAKWMESMRRLIAFAAKYPVRHIVGCHVEISATGQDYRRGTTYQPDEPPMQMDVAMLRRTFEFAKTHTQPGIHFSGDVYLCVETRGRATIDKNPDVY